MSSSVSSSILPEGVLNPASSKLPRRKSNGALFLERSKSISSPRRYSLKSCMVSQGKNLRVSIPGTQSSCKFGGEIEICSRLALGP